MFQPVGAVLHKETETKATINSNKLTNYPQFTLQTNGTFQVAETSNKLLFKTLTNNPPVNTPSI